MSLKLSVTSDVILNKKFKADIKGYDAIEIDAFLDLIIKDVAAIEQFIKQELPNYKQCADQLKETKEKMLDLEIKLAVMKEKFEGLRVNDTMEINQHNLELHKRINALEKALYKMGADPSKIK